jgi:hypothetical protein
LSLAEPDIEAQPAAMLAADGQGLEWRMVLNDRPGPDQRIRLVARAAGSSYFAEAGTLFLQPSDRMKLQR